MSQTIFPTFRYRDAHAAIDFLERAFGFERVAVYEDEGIVHHAELRLGDSMIMLGSDRDAPGPTAGAGSVYVVVQDPDAHRERALAAGADASELTDQDYGSRDYVVVDPEGNRWAFGTYDPFSVEH